MDMLLRKNEGFEVDLNALQIENQQLRAEINALKQQAINIKINGPNWPVTFNADGMATVHNADFINDPLFSKAYALGIGTGHRFGDDVNVQWRTFVCCWAAHQAKKLGRGDFVECGVNTGILSRAVMEYIDYASMTDRAFYLLDTYEGIPIDQLCDAERGLGIEAENAMYFDCYDLVCKTFSPFPQAKVVRGRVPETLAAIESEKICYLSIDMNSVAPEIAAGNYLWPRLISGAVVVLDDYGWKPHINQKHAWDAFAAERGIKVLALPTGQGLMIKP